MNEVPLKPDLVCDRCGKQTWCYDFYGDFYCGECITEMFKEHDDEDEDGYAVISVGPDDGGMH